MVGAQPIVILVENNSWDPQVAQLAMLKVNEGPILQVKLSIGRNCWVKEGVMNLMSRLE